MTEPTNKELQEALDVALLKITRLNHVIARLQKITKEQQKRLDNYEQKV